MSRTRTEEFDWFVAWREAERRSISTSMSSMCIISQIYCSPNNRTITPPQLPSTQGTKRKKRKEKEQRTLKANGYLSLRQKLCIHNKKRQFQYDIIPIPINQ